MIDKSIPKYIKTSCQMSFCNIYRNYYCSMYYSGRLRQEAREAREYEGYRMRESIWSVFPEIIAAFIWTRLEWRYG
jgi:heme/copper-type cytochrome/quinol oxidase subunit 2